MKLRIRMYDNICLENSNFLKDAYVEGIRSFDMIHLLTAIWLSPGGSTHLHTNNT